MVRVQASAPSFPRLPIEGMPTSTFASQGRWKVVIAGLTPAGGTSGRSSCVTKTQNLAAERQLRTTFFARYSLTSRAEASRLSIPPWGAAPEHNPHSDLHSLLGISWGCGPVGRGESRVPCQQLISSEVADIGLPSRTLGRRFKSYQPH